VKTHEVKSWTHYYDNIVVGLKKHDLRKNDRDYKVGDELLLKRYDHFKGEFTGETMLVKITYITSSQYPCAYSSAVLDKNYVILSIDPVYGVDVRTKPKYTPDFILEFAKGQHRRWYEEGVDSDLIVEQCRIHRIGWGDMRDADAPIEQIEWFRGRGVPEYFE